MAGLTPREIENWVKLDSSNSITDSSEILYRIAANIPEKIVQILLANQEEGQYYFGSVLRIFKSGKETDYTLGFYTIQEVDESFQTFVIGRTNYSLKDIRIDYERYLNSSDYIDLNLSIRNIDLEGNIFCQAIKAGDLYGLTQINQMREEISSRTALFVGDKTLVYYAIDNLPNNSFSTIPVEEYTKFSITPSVLLLAQYNPYDDFRLASKSKDIKRKNKKQIKAKLIPSYM